MYILAFAKNCEPARRKLPRVLATHVELRGVLRDLLRVEGDWVHVVGRRVADVADQIDVDARDRPYDL
jgi:hypothetical protein